MIRIGTKLKVPGHARATAARPAAARTATYLVRSGDTVSDIAHRLKVSPGTVLTAQPPRRPRADLRRVST